MAAKHTPPGDDSFRSSLARNLGGGVGLVLFVAMVFFGVGRFAGDDGVPEVAGADPDRQAATEEPDEQPEEPEESEPEDEEPEEAEPEPEPEPEPDPEDTEGDDEDEAAPTDDGDADAEEPADEAPAASEPADIPRGDISVQVLDGVGTDGGAASQRVAAELDGLGYRIIARNPALAYEQTTVLWTSGNEDRARQVAADLGAAAVRQQPGNLSEQVDVHVVVGADRA